MSQLATSQAVEPAYDPRPDAGLYVPAALPVRKAPATRRVGVVKAYTPRKTYGMVEAAGKDCDAIFCIEDVAPGDRPHLDSGQAVTFEIVEGPDGSAARQIRIDTTTLPPPPDDAMISRGWR